MLYSKSKSGLFVACNNKTTPASKIVRPGSANLDPDSPSSQQNLRLSINASPRSTDSKPAANRRSPKMSTTPDKLSRPLKVSELQVQLTALQEDFKNAKDHLAFEEKEKARVLVELSDAKKAAEEVTERLAEALLAQKKAEKSLEIDKFRADELEQSAIEAAQMREEEWKTELEEICKQHDVDVAALLSVTEELQMAKHELAMTTDAKNTALSHADDAMKIAEINAEKVEILSGEINSFKALLDSKLESKSNETAELIKKLGSEADALKLELEKAKVAEDKLVDMEALVEGIKNELTDAKRAESDAAGLVDEWKKKAELLASLLEQANQSERMVQDSLVSVTKQLEESTSMLDDSESEAISLRVKVEALELEVARHKVDLEESDHQLDLAKQEVLDVTKTIEIMKSEIQRMEEEEAESLKNEQLTNSNAESLTQENSRLTIELGITKVESEKTKKAMEGLASALHEVSTKARDMQERLLIMQVDVESATAEVDELKLALNNAQERYEVVLDEAKYEIVCLKKAVDKSKTEAEDLRAEWDVKEINLTNSIKNNEDELVSIRLEMDKAVEVLEMKTHEVKAAEQEANKLHDNIRQAESELVAANEAMEEAKAESMHLQITLLNKEIELQSITQENEDLRASETAASEKIKELSESLPKVTSKKSEENGDSRGNAEYGENRKLSDGDEEHDILPKMVEIREIKINQTEIGKPAPSEESQEAFMEGIILEENGNGNAEEVHLVKKESKTCDVGVAMDKQLPSEMEHYAKSIDDELDTKIGSKSLDQVNGENAQNGSTSPTKQQQLNKKKKALLHKFGSLLKKKTNHK